MKGNIIVNYQFCCNRDHYLFIFNRPQSQRSARSGVPVSEYKALKKLYDLNNGDNWVYKTIG